MNVVNVPSSSSLRPLLLAGAVILASVGVASPSWADAPPDKVHAKEAYDRGLEAHKRGDLTRAAEEFARADSLAPSAVALQAALDAAIEADDAALGAELLERSKREPAPPPALASSITAAHLKFNGRAGRVRVTCPPKATCLAKVDERPAEIDKIVWARTGQRTVIVQVDGEAQTKLIEVGTEQVVEVSPSAKAGGPLVAKPTTVEKATASSPSATRPAETEPPKDKRGILEKGFPPIIFYAGVGATVLAAGATVFFAVSTSSSHSDFTNAGCDKANFPDCEKLKRDGEQNQLATNIGFAVTGVLAVGTGLIGLFLTNWKGPVIAAHPGGGEAVWRVTF